MIDQLQHLRTVRSQYGRVRGTEIFWVSYQKDTVCFGISHQKLNNMSIFDPWRYETRLGAETEDPVEREDIWMHQLAP